MSFILIGVMVLSGCGDDECYDGDSRNVRKILPLQTSTFPGVAAGNCGIIENPAGLMFIYNEDPEEVFNECAPIGNLDAIYQEHWLLELEINGQCADQKRYTEVFRPTNSSNNWNDGCIHNTNREMPIQSANVGSTLFMCPDPHRPNNYGFADYQIALVMETPAFSSQGSSAGSCSGCQDGHYRVFLRTDATLEGVGFDDDMTCALPGFQLPPFSAIPECI